MSFEQVREYLAGMGLKALEFDVSSATVELAAVAVGCEPQRIAKAVFHQKAKMLGHEQVAELTGFPVGGVCPFLAPEGVKVYLDESLRRFDTVFPAAGTRNSAVEVTLPQLEAASHAAGWVDVSQIME